MAAERLSGKFESYYREVGKAYDIRAPRLEQDWESPAMKAYRQAALLIYRDHFAPPNPGQTGISLLEYGAGIGRIARQLVKEPYFTQKSHPVTITAVDVSQTSLSLYEKSVPTAHVRVQPVLGDIATVLGKLSPETEYDTIYANGAYQIPPPDMGEIIRLGMKHLRQEGKMIFDFLPAAGKLAVSHQKSPRGGYDTYHYSTDRISAYIRSAVDANKEGYRYRFIRLSELKDPETGIPYGPLTVPDIEKGSGEKQVDPVYCIITKSQTAPEERRRYEEVYDEALTAAGALWGREFKKIPLVVTNTVTDPTNDSIDLPYRLDKKAGGMVLAVNHRLPGKNYDGVWAGVTSYAIGQITGGGGALPAAFAYGPQPYDNPYGKLRQVLGEGSEALRQATKTLDIGRIVSGEGNVDGVSITLLGNALMRYIRETKGLSTLGDTLLKSAEGTTVSAKADRFLRAASHYYGSVEALQKGFFRAVMGESAVSYREAKNPLLSFIGKTYRSIIGFFKRLFS